MDGLLTNLGQNYGIVGLVLAISLSLNFWLLKMLLTEKDKRIQAAESVTTGLTTPIAYIKDSLELIQQKIRISKGE